MSNEQEWLAEFNGKTLSKVRSQFEGSKFLPHVVVEFEDTSVYEIHVKPNVFFEGCHLNTLRRPQPVTAVEESIDSRTTGDELNVIEVMCNSFTLFTLRAKPGNFAPDQTFPFVLTKVA